MNRLFLIASLLTAPVASLVSPVADALKGAQDISGYTKSVETVFTSEQIDEILPHRYPFALVDKVVEYDAGKSAVGIKSVTKVRIENLVGNAVSRI